MPIEQEILKIAASQGLWAVLFVALLFWVLRENARREERYQTIIESLSEKLGVVYDIKQTVDKIEVKVMGG